MVSRQCFDRARHKRSEILERERRRRRERETVRKSTWTARIVTTGRWSSRRPNAHRCYHCRSPRPRHHAPTRHRGRGLRCDVRISAITSSLQSSAKSPLVLRRDRIRANCEIAKAQRVLKIRAFVLLKYWWACERRKDFGHVYSICRLIAEFM